MRCVNLQGTIYRRNKDKVDKKLFYSWTYL